MIAIFCFIGGGSSLFGNGGAWQTGVPVTGNAAATDQKKSTNVTIEDEKLTIDLHQEFAAVEVRYRMKNTGGQVEQDFFFPVERWAESEDEAGNTRVDLEDYAISADGTELKFDTVDAKGAKPKAEKENYWGEFKPGVRLWKKSAIPFAQGQTREILIRYRSPYAANQSGVSEDYHSEAMYFRYSLSPASTWKSPIGKGEITINYLHPRPEEISITKPKNRFKKINDTQFVWEFQNLKPTLADRYEDRGPPGVRYLSGRARRSQLRGNESRRRIRGHPEKSVLSSAQRLRCGRELDAKTGARAHAQPDAGAIAGQLRREHPAGRTKVRRH